MTALIIAIRIWFFSLLAFGPAFSLVSMLAQEEMFRWHFFDIAVIAWFFGGVLSIPGLAFLMAFCVFIRPTPFKSRDYLLIVSALSALAAVLPGFIFLGDTWAYNSLFPYTPAGCALLSVWLQKKFITRHCADKVSTELENFLNDHEKNV
jgi:hypothetical protein